MARGNDILCNGEFGKGRYQPLFNGSGGSLYPGTIVQIDPTVALKGNVATAIVFSRDADGDHSKGALFVVTHEMQKMVGKLATDSIPSGEMFQGYAPINGDEINLLVADANTGTTQEDIAVGTLMMVDTGTGLLVATTGSPETEVAYTQEACNDMSAARLVWCSWSGN